MIANRSFNLAFHANAQQLDFNKPTLVFIHGAGGSGIFWENQLYSLSDIANTIALDLPGRGLTPGPGSDKITDYAKAVNEFIGELKPPNPILVGFSMGGAITQQILVENSGSYQGAVLISTGAKLKVHPQVIRSIENDFAHYLELVANTAKSPKTDVSKVQAVVEDRAACEPKVAADDFRACDAFDLRDQISSIETRVLIISAEDDLLTPPKFGQFLESNLPQATRVHIYDAGHLVSIEKPDEVNQAIRDFVGSF
jgi:pimeloyl-ACP methyl ester carboxylesterase